MIMAHKAGTMEAKGMLPLRKVILTMNEEYTYQQVKRYVDQGGTIHSIQFDKQENYY